MSQTAKSLCPVCLTVLPAARREDGAAVFLERACPEHGFFSERIWQGPPLLHNWSRPKSPSSGTKSQTETLRGCPFDCGRCPEHKQHVCTVLLEVTGRCNLRCPVCFAGAGEHGPALPEQPFPSLKKLRAQLAWIHEQAGPVVLQLSGGEPTLYPELAGLVREAANLFPAVQLNTNGLLLAEDANLAPSLAAAGLSWVFLQFDGTRGDIHAALRGKDLLRIKTRAIEACHQAGLAVVLTPTLAKGVNDDNLGDLLDFALARTPTVRGLHLQPMCRSGRNTLDHRQTLTLPEVLHALSLQSRGRIHPGHAVPPGCEHERCSFHCRYVLDDKGGLTPLPGAACCAPGALEKDDGSGRCFPEDTGRGAQTAIESVIRNWRGAAPPTDDGDAFARFINQARARTFSITCMAFQDAWSVDLDRLQGCCVHVFAPPDKLIPFCSFNLTNQEGVPLHRARP